MKAWLRLTLVTITVGGGFTGLAITLQTLLTLKGQPPASYVLLIVFLALFAFITISGLVFVQNPRCIRPLVIALSLQIPWVSSPIVTYKLAAGFQVSAAFIGGRFNGGFRLGSDFQVYLFQPLPWGIGLNLFALVMLVLLLGSARRANGVGALETSAPVQPESSQQ